MPESVTVDQKYFLGKKGEKEVKEVKVEKREDVTQIARDNEEESRRRKILKWV